MPTEFESGEKCQAPEIIDATEENVEKEEVETVENQSIETLQDESTNKNTEYVI